MTNTGIGRATPRRKNPDIAQYCREATCPTCRPWSMSRPMRCSKKPNSLESSNSGSRLFTTALSATSAIRTYPGIPIHTQETVTICTKPPTRSRYRPRALDSGLSLRLTPTADGAGTAAHDNASPLTRRPHPAESHLGTTQPGAGRAHHGAWFSRPERDERRGRRAAVSRRASSGGTPTDPVNENDAWLALAVASGAEVSVGSAVVAGA